MKHNILVLLFCVFASVSSYATFCSSGTGASCSFPSTAIGNAMGTTCNTASNSTDNCDTFTDASYPCGSSDDNDYWFQVTTRTDGCYDMEYTLSGGSTTDSWNMMIVSGTCGASYGIIDASCGPINGSNTITAIREAVNTSSTETFWIVVSPTAGSTATGFTLCQSIASAGSPPSNDNCSSMTNLTSGMGVDAGGGTGDALSTTNHCATSPNTITVCGDTDADEYTYISMASCYITNISGYGDGTMPGSTNCWPSVENTVWYTYTPSVTSTYYFHLLNQVCNTTTGVQFLVTSAVDCSDASVTASSMMTTTGGGPACTSNQNTADIYLTINLTGGVTYYIAVDGYAGTSCNFELVVGQVLLIPIDFIDLKAVAFDSFNAISWKTFTESNVDYFRIQRSIDGKNFTTVADIEAANANGGEYYYEDATEDIGTWVYYRVQQIHCDKVIGSSKTVYTGKDKVGVQHISSYFNQNGDVEMNLISGKTSSYNIQVLNLGGQEMMSSKGMVEAGNQKVTVNTSTLARGTYVVSMTLENGTTISKVLVK